MFYREIIAVCFEIHTKHINTSTLYGQIVELLTLNLVVRIVTIGLKTVKIRSNLLLQPSIYKQLLNFFFISIQLNKEGNIILYTPYTFPNLFYSHPPSPHIML